MTCANAHYSAFVPRSAIAQGVGTCFCGELLEPTCLDDRCYLPGAAGEVAEGEHPLKPWTCDECKPRPVKGTVVRLFDAPQTTPGQMTLD